MDKLKLIYDIETIPFGINLDEMYNIMRHSGIIVWDSTKGGVKPEIIQEKDITLFDVGFLTEAQFNERFDELTSYED